MHASIQLRGLVNGNPGRPDYLWPRFRPVWARRLFSYIAEEREYHEQDVTHYRAHSCRVARRRTRGSVRPIRHDRCVPGSGTGTSEPGMTTGAPTANQPTATQPGGMTADIGQGQQFSQSTLENVQEQLQQQGFYKSAKVDGRWGPQTRRAVQSFQQAKGMPATGQLDEQTLGALGVNNQGG